MLKKVKKWFGIEGLKLAVQLEESYDRKNQEVDGLIILQSKDSEVVESISIKIIEKYSRGRGKNKLIDEYLMTNDVINQQYVLEPESILEIPFRVDITEKVSRMDEIERSNFLLGGIVKTAKFIKRAKSTYRIEIEANVKGTKFSPFATREFILK